jgi:hypothetical protein
MKKELKVFVKEYSVATYHDVLEDWLYISWSGEQTMESRISAFNLLLEFLKTSHCTKILNDNSQNTTPWSDCALWITNEWIPEAEANGMQALAWVYSENETVRQSAEEMINRISGKSIVIAFNDLKTAKHWLHSV